MEVSLRLARIGDCARLMELVHELALYEKLPHEVEVSLSEFKEAGFGARPVWKAFVAEVDGTIVGFALFYTRYSTWKGRRIYLEDLLCAVKVLANFYLKPWLMKLKSKVLAEWFGRFWIGTNRPLISTKNTKPV